MLRATAVVTCDDIRLEANGKHILVGVYQGKMRVPQLPFVTGLSWWILATPTQIGSSVIDLRLRMQDGETIFQGRIGVQINELSETLLALPPTLCQFLTEGTAILEWQQGTDIPSGEWSQLSRLIIQLDPSLKHQLSR